MTVSENMDDQTTLRLMANYNLSRDRSNMIYCDLLEVVSKSGHTWLEVAQMQGVKGWQYVFSR